MVETLSPSFSESAAQNQEIGFGSSSLQFFHHGIDSLVKDRSQGYLYEEVCFTAINEKINSGLVIGPHLIDSMFNKKEYKIADAIRPDGIWLDKTNQSVILKTFYEFKSGSSEKSDESIPKKIKGFKDLSGRLRAHPTLLPKMLKNSIGYYFNIPDKIEIPENIEFIFYTPDIRQPNDGVPFVKYQTHRVPILYAA